MPDPTIIPSTSFSTIFTPFIFLIICATQACGCFPICIVNTIYEIKVLVIKSRINNRLSPESYQVILIFKNLIVPLDLEHNSAFRCDGTLFEIGSSLVSPVHFSSEAQWPLMLKTSSLYPHMIPLFGVAPFLCSQ